MNVYQNAFRIDASVVSPNRIELKPDNVATLRLYLNDRLVDLKKPVTVVVNKKVKFEGLVKPSVEEMLADQLYLGRGWRYYSAVIDLDLAEAPARGPSTRPTTSTPTAPARPSPSPRR
jgi:hypothetical protein